MHINAQMLDRYISSVLNCGYTDAQISSLICKFVAGMMKPVEVNNTIIYTRKLQGIRTTLEKVRSIIESTYDHDDETGERIDEQGDYSASDIVEFICEIEGIVDDSLEAISDLIPQPQQG